MADAPTAAPGADGSTVRTANAHLDRSAAIYGSLLVTALVAAESRYGGDIDFLALSILVSTGVFWLMEVWSQLVNLRVRGPITPEETAMVAGRASPMIAAAVLPMIILLAPRVGVLTVDQAIAVALAACVVQLFVWGLAVGHAIGKGWPTAVKVAVGDCLLGLVIVALKVIVIH